MEGMTLVPCGCKDKIHREKCFARMISTKAQCLYCEADHPATPPMPVCRECHKHPCGCPPRSANAPRLNAQLKNIGAEAYAHAMADEARASTTPEGFDRVMRSALLDEHPELLAKPTKIEEVIAAALGLWTTGVWVVAAVGTAAILAPALAAERLAKWWRQ